MRLAEVQSAHQPDTYAYFFTHSSPAAGGILGSCHALEIAFVFGTLTHPGVNVFTGEGPELLALSEQMMDAWLAFAHTGNPSTPAAAWPAYDASRRATMILGPGGGAQDAPWEDERAFWD
jgi:para-nitrobenzyl esterase